MRIVRIFAPIGLDTHPNSSNGTDSPINNPEITLEGTKCDFSIPVHLSFARFLSNFSCGVCILWNYNPLMVCYLGTDVTL